MTGAELIAQERQRQIDEEQYSLEHDATWHSKGELARAAACYAFPNELRCNIEYAYIPNSIPSFWPWSWETWKPTPQDRIWELVKAGALIAAEIDRLQKLPRSRRQ
ncbi:MULTISPECIES: hypothetical protein [unclassified Desulfovibrio]|uniref:hypothetical protein n=1 Tax=unclassified Desulfovibrio TaxID=2593640 RepID=UPI0013EBD8DE|nr:MULTISPECIES: hypothetical protein [unclassified Desulfovibrio]